MVDINEEVAWSLEGDVLSISLKPNQYQLNKLDQYQYLLQPTDVLLPGELVKQDKDSVVVKYTLEDGMVPLTQVLSDYDLYDRLQIAQQLYILNDLQASTICPLMNPHNLFVSGRRLVIAHRGFKEGVYPWAYSDEAFLKQYRALVLSILHPRLNYQHLIEGNGTLKDELSQIIQEATSVEAIIGLIDQQLAIEDKRRHFQFKTVKKSKFNSYKWGTFILGATSLIALGGVGYYYFHEVPMQERVISAETQFINHDYEGVLSTLEKDDPTQLPKSAQYVGAVSAIKLENLSNNQKEVILKGISQKSNENILLYWLNIGNGDFNEALNIAKNIGDNQYILNAYIKLYDETKANSTMNGNKKQELLTQYKEQIQEYTKKLGGK